MIVSKEHNQGALQWIVELKRFARVEALLLLCLGFSAGLPYLLVQGTLSAWLKEAGLEYRTIGFFAWVALAYALKVLWAPFVDRLRFPLLCLWLGQRRGWLLAAQLGISGGLLWMSMLSPTHQTELLAFAAVFVAFCAATQDVCVDAYRIQAVKSEMQGIVTSAYIAGYRLAILVAGAGALLIADDFNWQVSYQVMAALMVVGVVTVLWMREPESNDHSLAHYQDAQSWVQQRFPARSDRFYTVLAWCWVHVLEPFAEMISRYGRLIFLLIAAVLLYRVSDIAMGNMANPFYLALGYSKTEIAWVTKVFGLVMMLLGSAVGGILVASRGLYTSMLACLVAVVLTNLLFAVLASIASDCLDQGQACVAPALFWLGAVISADNLAAGASNVVFIAFLSNQVNVTYSATQYALLSSAMSLLGKFVSGFSGVVVDEFGFSSFFVYISCWGLPSLIVLLLLRRYCPASFLPQPTQEKPGENGAGI